MKRLQSLAPGKRAKWMACALMPLFAATGCQTVETTQSGVVGVEREQRFARFVSEKQVEQQAAQEYGQIMAAARKKGLLNRDAQQLQRVRTVAQRLIPQVDAFRPDALKWAWETNVLTSKEVNAWCMPGGKIAVYTGLLERLQLSDDELAAVVGHEIAHALREHAREQIGRQMATQAWAAHTLTEIAFSWGFNSAAHFTRTFNEKYGVAPREFRKLALGRD